MRTLFSLLVCLALALPGQAADPPAPRIASPARVQELGQILRGTVLERTFVLQNRGDAPLDITDVQAACDCTTVPLARTRLAPGESLSLRVKLDTAKLLGPIEKSILLTSNDPQLPVFALELRGQVLSPYALEPAMLRFAPIGRNRAWSATLTLARTDGEPLRVQGVRVKGNSSFHARFRKTPGRESGEIVVAYQPGAEPHPVEATVEVVLDDPLQPTLEAPLVGRVLRDIGVFPARLEFGPTRPGEMLGPRVLLTFHNPEVELQSVSCEPEVLAFEVVPRRSLPAKQGLEPGPAKGVEIRIRLKPGAVAGAAAGKIILHTSCIDQDRIEIPFQGTVSAR